MSKKLLKSQLRALENIFAAEIEGRLPFQSKARIYSQLVELGLAKFSSETRGRDRFGAIRVSGYYLTERGRFEYCQSCPPIEEETP